jgi:hypothetical protein
MGPTLSRHRLRRNSTVALGRLARKAYQSSQIMIRKQTLFGQPSRNGLEKVNLQNMAYNLSSILTAHNLEHLDEDFSQQEIE